MKRLTALVLAWLLLTGSAALAAEWAEGLGPDQPYHDTPRVNLDSTVGYIVLFPRGNKPARGYCDMLQMYFPREDIQIGEGMLRVYEQPVETPEADEAAEEAEVTEAPTAVVEPPEPVETPAPGPDGSPEFCAVDVSDSRNVKARPMTEREMEAIMWGGGSCVEIRLPKSLEYADGVHQYYVTMDEGCVVAGKDGTLKSPRISEPIAWQPSIGGEYGVSGLYYVDDKLPAETEEENLEMLFDALTAAQDAIDAAKEAKEAEEAEEAEEGDEAEDESDDGTETIDGGQLFGVQAPPEADEADDAEETEEDAPQINVEVPGFMSEETLRAGTPVAYPDTGDKVFFDLVLGGEAAIAVPFSENGSVHFDTVEFTESTSVMGTVLKDEVDWGILFLKEDGTMFDVLPIGPATERQGG